MGTEATLLSNFAIRVPLEVELKLKKPVSPSEMNLQKLSTIIQLSILEIVFDLISEEETPGKTVTFIPDDEEDESRLTLLIDSLSKLIGIEVKSLDFKAV